MMMEKAKKIIQRLLDHGYEAYFVGGFVRDLQWNRPIKDIDIATSALPEQIMELFPHAIPTGIQHGTVTVVIDKQPFEVTTFRKEAEYEDFRRPKQVEFISDLYEDLRRRDFTMNAMAMDLSGQIIDPFGGLQDIKRGIIRCVGKARDRFQEDALRMLRCIRFASEYDLQIEQATWSALLMQKHLLRHIAMERIQSEFERIMESRHVKKGIALLVESQILREWKEDVVLPLEPFHQLLQRHDDPIVTELAQSHLRWALMLLLSQTSAKDAKSIMKRMKYSGKKIKSVTQIIEFHEWFLTTERQAHDWKKGAVFFGQTPLIDWRNIMVTLKQAGEKFSSIGIDTDIVDHLERYGLQWLDEMPVKHLKDLQITGRDLMHHIHKRSGAWIGQVLERLLIDTALQRVPNEKDKLLDYAKQLVEEMNER